MYSSRIYDERIPPDLAATQKESPLAPIPRSFNSSLRPPPYSVAVTNLTIVAPPSSRRLPIIGISLPNWSKSDNSQEIIRGVNLDISSTEVLALIGGSGSGKTTLLNAIAGRLGSLQMTGAISFVPTTSSPHTPPLVLGYVRQEDTLLPYLSVRETLRFAAELRLPKSVSQKDRLAIVEQTITELGLMESVETLVGLLSGGQRRRVTIGCVLVTSCSVLVLDEPTTGLDSFTACRLLETLSNLAKNGGRTIILSIHQPRSDAFALFDKVTLLSAGSVVFSGPTRSLLPHFEQLGYVLEQHTNPLDFVIDISSIDTRTDALEATTTIRVYELVAAWKRVDRIAEKAPERYSSRILPSQPSWTDARNSIPLGEVEKGSFSLTKERMADSQSSRNTENGDIIVDSRNYERPGWIGQTVILTRRSLKNVTRNRGFIFGLAAQSVILGVALGLAFLNPPETPAGIQTFKTIIFQSTPAFFYLSIIIAVAVWVVELQVFDREREDGLYSAVPFVLASTISFLPANIVFPMIYGIIIYFMTGFTRANLAVNLLSFLSQCVMQQISAYGYALCAASLSRTFAGASLLANGFAIPFILSAGYLIIELPIWISWTRWISPYFYGFRWIATLQLRNRVFACDGITGPAANACDGDAVLVGLAFPTTRPLYIYPLGLLGFAVVTHILATIVLHFYKPGGVQHAAKQSPSKNSLVVEDGITKEKSRIPMHDQVEVQVNRLSLSVTQKSLRGRAEEKIILQDISCAFPAGEVSVIMGPSGAGKSSLLSVLAGRSTGGLLSNFVLGGEILLNGSLFDDASASSIAFVAQDDSHHLPALTVRETLHYAATLRLRMPAAQQIARAEAVIRMLGLKLCADNLVGGELLKGISGGEKRRLTLAEALLSDVSVLYADEPLSGLDAYSALNVMLTLKNLAASGITVVLTVHQPRSEIWKLADNVLLLAEGGRTVYSGQRDGVLEFFESNKAICPPNFNAADFILDQISIDHRSKSAEDTSTEKVARFVSSWERTESSTSVKSSPHHLGIESAKKLALSDPTSTKNDSPESSTKRASAPFHIALPVLVGRSFKNLRRQQDAALARIINPPFLALLFFLFFGRLDLAASTAQTRIGILQETTALPFVGMLACLSIFPVERNLFLHEHKSASSRQSVFTFLLAYTLQEILVSIISSGLFSLVVVFGIRLQNSPRIFIEFWVSSFALINLGESIGIFFCAFVDNGGLAVSLVSVGITILSQLNGIISVTLPTWLEYLGWASPLKLQARIQIINEFTGLVFDCSDAQIASGACIAQTGEQLLETFNITGGISATGGYVAIIIGSIVVYRLLALVALHIRVAL